tara:strand:- start:29357 stop:30823 length:1467 start_codon:yes stop_codon:yes gene_type:complete
VEDYTLAIIVPYRDRRKDLDIFVPHMDEFLSDKNIDYTIFVIEQEDDRPFNRGKLLNIGFDLIKDDFDYFCFHDVDMLPINDDCDYSYDDVPIHLASELESYNYKLPYEQFFGGVVLFTKEDFIEVNGYSNEYWGYGVEDLDMMYRIEKAGLQHEVQYDISGVTKQLRYSLSEVKVSNSLTSKEIKYITLDGSSSLVIKNGNPKLLNLTNNSYTLSVWVRPHDKGERMQGIISRPGHHSGIFYNTSTKMMESKFQSQVWDKNKLNYIVDRSVKSNEWYFVTMTLDTKTKKIKMYVNGVQVIDKFNRQELEEELFDYETRSWFIGNSYANKNPFIGDIADVKIYDKVLTDEEVEQEYFGGIDIKPLVNIDFSKGYRNTYFDVTSNHCNLMISTDNILPYKTETIKLGNEYPIPVRKNGRYKCLKHKGDNQILEKYDSFDPDIEANLEIFFEDIRTDEVDYKTIGLNNLSYKILDRETFQDRHEWVKVVT